MRWRKYLVGFSHQELARLIQPRAEEESPVKHGQAKSDDNESDDEAYRKQSEAGLAEACKATLRLKRRVFQVAYTYQVGGKASPECVNHRRCGTESQENLFYSEQKVKTIHKYCRRWVKILR
ncbi:hypothetical protein LTR95_016581, partial [Oleoguttula sp. CCFEE 5521]